MENFEKTKEVLKNKGYILDSLPNDNILDFLNQKIDWSSCKPLNGKCWVSDDSEFLKYVYRDLRSYTGFERERHEIIAESITSILNEESDEELIRILRMNGLLLRFVPPERKTYDICIAACGQSTWAFRYVGEFQDELLCYTMVLHNPRMFKYVKKQTDVLIKIILDKKPELFEYVKIKTPDLCEYALKCGAPLESTYQSTFNALSDAIQYNTMWSMYIINKLICDL